MSSVLRVILVIGSVCFFIFILNMVRTKKLELKYALTWILTSFSFVLLSLFPEILFFIAALMHVELPVNALYLCVIFLLLMIVYPVCRGIPPGLENKNPGSGNRFYQGDP